MKWFKWKAKENTGASAHYFLDEGNHTCHFFQDCKLKGDSIRAIPGKDWALKYYRYVVCPECASRNTKDLYEGIKWTLMGALVAHALKETGKDKDPEAIKMVKEALQDMWDKEHSGVKGNV
jgi:hypothetical protein